MECIALHWIVLHWIALSNALELEYAVECGEIALHSIAICKAEDTK